MVKCCSVCCEYEVVSVPIRYNLKGAGSSSVATFGHCFRRSSQPTGPTNSATMCCICLMMYLVLYNHEETRLLTKATTSSF